MYEQRDGGGQAKPWNILHGVNNLKMTYRADDVQWKSGIWYNRRYSMRTTVSLYTMSLCR